MRATGNWRSIITRLYLNGTKVAGGTLSQFTALNVLELNGCPIDDAGLSHLERLTQLKILYLNDTQVTDAGLPTLARLKNLRELFLDNAPVTARGIAGLRAALPECKVSARGVSP